MQFDTRIAVILRDDLAVWQKLNVTAFTVSGVAATVPNVTGDAYRDGSGSEYLPMFRQPVFIYEADENKIRTIFDRMRTREVFCSIFTEDLFATNNDDDNRAAVASVPLDGLRIVGMAFRADKKIADKILKGVSLHSS